MFTRIVVGRGAELSYSRGFVTGGDDLSIYHPVTVSSVCLCVGAARRYVCMAVPQWQLLLSIMRFTGRSVGGRAGRRVWSVAARMRRLTD